MLKVLFVFLCALSLSAAPSSLTILPSFPQEGHAYTEGELGVSVAVQSEFEVVSVSAELGGREISLIAAPGGKQWYRVNAADFSGLASGAQKMRFKARDVFGSEAEAEVSFIIDRLPVVHVKSPLKYNQASARLEFEASCEDAEGGCTVVFHGAGGQQKAPNSLRGFADLSGVEEGVAQLHFFALDERGRVAEDVRYVTVVRNPRLRLVDSVDGRIADYSDRAILYQTYEKSINLLKIKDRFTGKITTVATNPVMSGSTKQWILPNGAFVTRQSATTAGVEEVVEYNQGEFKLDTNGIVLSRSSNGRFGVIVQYQGPAILRDFVEKTNGILTTNIFSASVANNGTAALSVYSPANELLRYQDGRLESIVSSESGIAFERPRTDGTNTVWLEGASLWAQTAQGKVLLVDAYGNYDIAGGWIAYEKIGAQGFVRVWLRSPAGVETQGTFFSEPSTLLALGEDGTLLVRVRPAKLYLIRPGAVPQFIGNEIYNYAEPQPIYQRLGDGFYLNARSAVYRIEALATAVGIGDARVSKETGMFSFFVNGTEPVSFEVERSTDLKSWTSVYESSLTNSGPGKVEVAIPPARLSRSGMYRVKARTSDVASE